MTTNSAHRPGCLTITSGGRGRPERLVAARPDEWVRAIRPVRLTPAERAVALELASYANKKDGTSARPGTDRLAWGTGATDRTVQAALRRLAGMYLIWCQDCGGGRAHARTWQLSLHDDIERRCPVESLDEWRSRYGVA